MKIVRYLVLVVVCVLWLGGCFQPVMHQLYETKVIVDDYRYGDLYRLSNLPQFKERQQRCPQHASVLTTKPVSETAPNLYVIGDSFTEHGRLAANDLPVHWLRWQHWEDPKNQVVQLDTTRRNILLLESVERHFREHAAGPINNLLVVADSNRTNSPKPEQPSWRAQLVDMVRSKGIEERLETVLFSHDLFQFFREQKAVLNQLWFDRVAPTVSLSTNKQHLFTDLDTNPDKPLNSSFAPLTNAEVDTLVAHLNQSAARYKQAGFDDVLLSIIPNKATLLDPNRGKYNHLIERIQQHPALTARVVDVYQPFLTQHPAPYALSDSHWNCAGRQIWLDTLAKALD
ncbi:hypothetical protein J2I47_05230 [Fibrella sp. HMF5335]|uniref:Uncharacterized protein n=1 Tax=Fibrella rubiginis TaxID=2817060 RepID=A0A939GCR0_9BACT|nr:hypothetical protein [Fibrella rubiginis]MBO0935941.1 hypothetical protein [Fibrella rubiginis]